MADDTGRPSMPEEQGEYLADSPIYATDGRKWLTAAGGAILASVAPGIMQGLGDGLGMPLLGTMIGVGVAVIGVSPWLLGMFRRRIRIGSDGVALRWLGRTRFFSYAEIAEVLERPKGFALRLESGRTIEVPLDAAVREKRKTAPAELAAALRDAHARYRAEPTVEGQAQLSRAHRTAGDWLTALRRVLASGGDYREAALSAEMLWSIVRSPAAEPSARAGAAVALKPTLDDADRERLRRLAETTAAPRVRVVLQAAADDAEEEVLVRELAGVQEHRAR